jgi:hypothetical protein
MFLKADFFAYSIEQNCSLSLKALQDHSAWALGNMAVESDEIRVTLRKNGVLQPLVKLLDSTVMSFIDKSMK